MYNYREDRVAFVHETDTCTSQCSAVYGIPKLQLKRIYCLIIIRVALWLQLALSLPPGILWGNPYFLSTLQDLAIYMIYLGFRVTHHGCK